MPGWGFVRITKLRRPRPGLMTTLLDGPTDRLPAGKPSADGPDRAVGEPSGRARHRPRRSRWSCPVSGPLPKLSDSRDDRAVVVRLEVSVQIQLIDHGLGAERLTSRRGR